jgi:hypothetical protein
VTLPQPGQWVRVRHACPDVTHDEPVEVVETGPAPLYGWPARGYSQVVVTRRCDGVPMNLYADAEGRPYPGDEWEVVT